MKRFLLVTADTNDADYVSSKTEISDEELKEVMPVIEAIKGFKEYKTPYPWDTNREGTHRNNFPQGDCLREDMGEKDVYAIYPQLSADQLDLFIEMFVPTAEYGIHTIESIETVYEGEKLL